MNLWNQQGFNWNRREAEAPKVKHPIGLMSFIPGERLDGVKFTQRKVPGRMPCPIGEIERNIRNEPLDKCKNEGVRPTALRIEGYGLKLSLQRGAVIMGEKRDVYVQNLKGNIDKWNAEIDGFQTKSDKAMTDAEVQFRKQIEELKVKRYELEQKMEELQNASETAWEDTKTGVDHIRKVLGESIEAVRSRFK